MATRGDDWTVLRRVLPSVFVACAFFLSALWAVHARDGRLGAAFATLVLCVAFATAASVLGPALSTGWVGVVGRVAYDLLSGWLLVAAALSLILWRGETSPFNSAAAILVVALASSGVAVGWRLPLLAIPSAWASLNIRPATPWSTGAIAASALGAVLAAYR